MIKIRENKGITLVTLIITVVVMLILAGISIGTGMDSIDKTKLKGFYTELQVIQKRVDSIASTNESYINSNNEQIYLKDTGTDLTSDQINFVTEKCEENGLKYNINNFRYFTAVDLSSILDIQNIEQNVFIDFENRVVISEKGIEVNDVKYYTLDTEEDTYFAEYNPNKNIGSIDFTCTIAQYGTSKYKITVIPTANIGDIGGNGIVKYKKSSSKYWETSNNLEIIIEELTNYDIIYQDAGGNSKTKKIKVELNENNQLVITDIASIST